MAYCANCGKQIPDNAKFCDGCGSPVAAEQPYNGEYTRYDGYGTGGGAFQTENNYGNTYQSENNYGGTYQYDNNYGGSYQSGNNYGGSYQPVNNLIPPVVRRIKETGGSIMQLVLILCMAATVILSFVSANNPLYSMYDMGYGLSEVMTVLTIIGCVPTALMVIGLLMFFFDCRNNPSPKGSGIGLYKAAKIVTIVYLAIIGVGLVLLFSLGGAVFSFLGAVFGGGFGVSPSIYGDTYGAVSGVMTGVFVFLIIIVCALLVLAIMFEVKLMSGANAVRNTLNAGVRRGTVPIYPAIIQIFIAIGCCISAVYTLLTGLPVMSYAGSYGYGGTVFLSIILVCISAFQAVLTIVMLFKIRAAVNQ